MKKMLLTTTAFACLSAGAPAFAQSSDGEEAQEGGLNVIVVTAQRREESVQDVPIAISAFDAAELETRGISNALEVTQFVPNLVGLNNTGLGTANSYYLRGIGNSESIATFDPPIGTYVDDIYMSRQNANNLSFFDVDRVEVLRGPQGTLFGRNTTGGAVSVFLKEPGDEVSGFAEVGYGSYERIMGRASIDLPLADSFAVKVSGYFQEDEGYAQNTVTGERTNENDGWGVRLGIRGELSDNARWTGSYIRTYSKSANLLNFDCDPNNPTNCSGRFSATGLLENQNFGFLTGPKDNFGLGNEVDLNFVSSNLELGVGDNLNVNIITGFVDIQQDFALDFADGRGLPGIANPVPPVLGFTSGGFTISNQGEHTQFTQEIKLTGSLADGLFDFVAGVYYFHEDNRTDFADIFSLNLPFAPAPTGFPLLLADREIRNEAEAWAGYLQADINVTDQIKLTAGIRYTDEEKTFSIRDNRPVVGTNAMGQRTCFGPFQFGPSTCIEDVNLVAPNGQAIPTTQNVKIWTPRFALNYKATDDILLFASATRGFKSGGWNARGTAPGELLPFDAETAWSYEVGAKTEFLDNRVRLNVTAFWLDVDGLQTPSAFIRNNGSIAFITRNFANYRNRGIEVELNTAPVDGLNIFASLGYQDDEYRFSANAPAFDAFGVQSVPAQQAACLAQLAQGLVPNGPTGTDPRAVDNATSCGVGIVAPDGSIAEPVRTPDWTLAIGGTYDADLGGGLSLVPSVNANWRSSSEVGTSAVTLFDGTITGPNSGFVYQANTLGNGNPIVPATGSFSSSRWIVNGSIALKSDTGWSITAECKNCFDEEAVESALANFSYLNPPRTFLIKGRFNF
ncbi:MAG: TonB-dependent receptor [Parasphingorhabdus sp.]